MGVYSIQLLKDFFNFDVTFNIPQLAHTITSNKIILFPDRLSSASQVSVEGDDAWVRDP